MLQHQGWIVISYSCPALSQLSGDKSHATGPCLACRWWWRVVTIWWLSSCLPELLQKTRESGSKCSPVPRGRQARESALREVIVALGGLTFRVRRGEHSGTHRGLEAAQQCLCPEGPPQLPTASVVQLLCPSIQYSFVCMIITVNHWGTFTVNIITQYFHY